ncbi:hypothetical protein A1F94_009504 [Pyrenophora tritici-repentis]|nr:hypothetical protein A1F94_009504 [Pyrenophora tritici-repentis]KAI1522915.1 hypothetical protein PtrSN001C_011662 [Pyrenophora tritici-repentis]KAI1592177.1 hypothetical protein PtrCC142_011658 [Pyrenophora tritici-repentis]
MERGRPQPATSKPALAAVPAQNAQNNAQKVVQDTGRKGVNQRMEDKTGRGTYRHMLTLTKKVLQLHERLSKRESVLLVQLRTEKVGLNDFFFSRHVPTVTSLRCSYGERQQTVAHFLLHCSRHKDLRNRIFANPSGRNSLRTILSTPQLVIKAIGYLYTLMHLQLPLCARSLVVIPRSPLSRLAQAFP